jgi:hypothetical protein
VDLKKTSRKRVKTFSLNEIKFFQNFSLGINWFTKAINLVRYIKKRKVASQVTSVHPPGLKFEWEAAKKKCVTKFTHLYRCRV